MQRKHLAGEVQVQVQDISFTLDGTIENDDYNGAVNKLNENVVLQKNILLETCVYTSGTSTRTVHDSFVSTLKKLATTCEFGDNRDNFIQFRSSFPTRLAEGWCCMRKN